MALPALGAISMADYNTELKNPAGTQLSMDSTGFRQITGKSAGSSTVSMTDGYGKTARVAITININASTYNYNLRNNMPGNYVAGKSDITVTVGYNVIVGSGSTGSPAMTISGFTAGDTITMTNYGKILGAGGMGGRGGDWYSADSNNYSHGQPGQGGGTALSVGYAVSISNAGQIAGGGGGGGGGEMWASFYWGYYNGGNGGGGGAGSAVGQGGAGGRSGPSFGYSGYSGAAGYAGSEQSGGGSPNPVGPDYNATGGAYQGGGGGNLGNAGASGLYCVNGNCNVSPWNAPGGGGAGGSCTIGNGYITWVSTGLRAGALN